jgi:DNA mismatch repair protein MutS
MIMAIIRVGLPGAMGIVKAIAKNQLKPGDYVWMDKFTIRNLELYHSTNANAVTLIDVIDHTISPMGGRLLKRWLALPLKSQVKIKARHEVVQG